MNYDQFIKSKRRYHKQSGFDADSTSDGLFEHQQRIVKWATRMGRCAIFADTGLGKTLMQLEWARLVHEHTSQPVLILAPLAVKEQTIEEGARFGIHVSHYGCGGGIEIINYDKLDHVECSRFAGIVLDESSILKSYDGKTRTKIIESFIDTPYKLACTATPAPNDFTELGNHAEFLGVSSRVEMLSEFFVHDGGSTQDWRLKKHSVRDFWKWVSSWAVLMRKPSDLGIDDSRYDLPDLSIEEVVVAMPDDHTLDQGTLFVVDATSLTEQRTARRESIAQRCGAAAELVQSKPDEQWLVWCELNDESSILGELIPNGVQVSGSDDPDDKAAAMLGFSRGEVQVLITKPKIAGFGMNWQICHNMIFVGPTHSYEQWYQAVRRCWRFGQQSPVTVYMIRSDADGHVWRNLNEKASAADDLASSMIELIRDSQLESVCGRRPGITVQPTKRTRTPAWL